jgi:uncharacterized membrane protein
MQDVGRRGILWRAGDLAAVVMVAHGTELHAAKSGGLIAIASTSVSFVVMFAVHYAHDFYGDFGHQHKGLGFPGKEQPDYWDFACFSIVIGMIFQVSDVQITSRELRRIALAHSVIAFFFNMFIIALTVNIVAGQA